MNNNLQGQLAEHHREQFGNVSVHRMLSKLAEEVGELNGAIIRHDERRDGRGWHSEVEAEFGDVQVVLIRIAEEFGFCMLEVQEKAIEKFLSREWPNVEKINEPTDST